jgi:RND family efflux transporter MFP subunit
VLGAFLVAVMKRRVAAWPVASAMLVAWATVFSVWAFTAIAWPWYAVIGASLTVLISLTSQGLWRARGPAAAAMVLLALGASACTKEAPPENVLTGAIDVSVEPVRLNVLRRVVTASGAVTPMPDADWTIYATETSTVAELPFNEGSPVAAGDVLARFEVPSRMAAIQMAELDLIQRTATAETARARVSQLSGLVDRGLAPRVDLDSAQADLAAAESALAATRATLSVTRAAEERATIRARFPGVVQRRWHYPGDTVLGTDSDPVIRIIDPTRVQITADVLAQDLGAVLPGQRATVTVLSGPPITASVTRVSQPATPEAATAQIVLTPLTSDTTLPADAPVLAEILIAEVPEAVVVPTAAIRRAEGAIFVLVAGNDNRVVRRDIRIGMTTTSLTQVLEGVSVGEFVITTALTELNEGDLVSFVR